jgi:hypothetical protein
MTVIGNLVTRFTADMSDLKQGVGQYDKEIATAEKKTADFSAGLGDLKAVALEVAAGIGIATAIIAGFIVKATGYADALTKASYATGLSVEQLQRWKAAGEETSVSMDEITTAARMMSSRMGEVSDPGSEMSKSLKDIGVSAYDTTGKLKDTNTLMWDIIVGLSQQESVVNRNSKALAVLGRSWYNLAPIINNVADAQDAYNKADPFSDQKIATLDKYNTALEKAGAASDRWAVTIGDKLTPLITGVFIPAVDALSGAISFLSTKWDEMQFNAAKNILSVQALLTGDSSKLNAFITAGMGGGAKSAASGTGGTGNTFLPDTETANARLEENEKTMWSALTAAGKEYESALKDVIDEKKKLADLDKDYYRGMSTVGWDVARARDLTIKHGWDTEDQTANVGASQQALSTSSKNLKNRQDAWAVAGNFIINVNGYNKTIAQAEKEAKDLAGERIKAGIPSGVTN